MAKASQVILLVEDRRHDQFIRRYLRKRDFGVHALRTVMSPSGAGSAEQWVRRRFAIEVVAYRRRQAETKLIVLIDADTLSVRERISQLDQALQEARVPPVTKEEEIARLVPRRNVETWILCLNLEQVDEDTDYKGKREDWTEMIRAAAGKLHEWARPQAPLPPSCVESLRLGIFELQRLRL